MATPTPIPVPKAPRPTHPETKAGTILEVVETPSQLRRFQHVPSTVYWHDPYYVYPLLADERRFLDPAANPFFRHADARLLIARHGNDKDVGRIALAVDRDQRGPDGKPRGFFGFLEFLGDARLPEHLLAEGVRWLRERGAGEIVGPLCFTLHHENRGILVENFDDDPVIATPYNPTNYHGFVARLPLEAWRDFHAYELDLAPEPPERLAKAARERLGLSVRAIDPARLDEEIEVARGVYNEAWKADPAFAPIAADEMRFLVRGLRFALDPSLFLFVEEKGKPVGFSWAVPDWNRVLKHLNGRRFPLGWLKAALLKRSIDRVRLLRFGVVGAEERGGATAALADATWRAIAARGYRRVVAAQVPGDDARAVGLLEGLGARRTRTWRVFRYTGESAE